MSTDFSHNNSAISTTGGFRPNKKNTPLDIRTVVNTKADIVNIPMPFIGMEITVLQDETNENKMTVYKVKSLNESNTIDISTGIENVTVPKNISDLNNDVKFVKESEISSKIDLSGYATKDELNTKANKTDIPTKNSQLTNDSNYLKSTDTINASSLNGKKFSEPMTKEEFDAITDKDLNTIYLVDDDNAINGVPDYSSNEANKILSVNDDGSSLIWKDVVSGSKGDKGDIGPTGPKGDTGVQGPQGSKGDKGDVGPTGPKGDAGLQGTQGKVGPTGPKGDKGEQGAKGQDGLTTSVKVGSQTFTQNNGIITLSGIATETFVTDKIAEAKLSGTGTVDLSGYATKDELNAKADKTAIPTKNSQLTNDSNYLKITDNIDASSLNGKKFSEPMTKEEYETIIDKDPNTIYLIDDDTIEGVPDYSSSDANKILTVNASGNALAWINAPYYTKAEIDSKIGDINTILDNINGEVI